MPPRYCLISETVSPITNQCRFIVISLIRTLRRAFYNSGRHGMHDFIESSLMYVPAPAKLDVTEVYSALIIISFYSLKNLLLSRVISLTTHV